MTDKIIIRHAATANTLVEKHYKGDSATVTLAAFEYGHQADIFAKALSRTADGVIIVRGRGRYVADTAFAGGRKLPRSHDVYSLTWEEGAR